jgi:hypothetical protein
LHLIYQNKLDVKDTIEIQSPWYLDIYPEIDNGGILKTKLYDKCDDLTFPMVNSPPSVVICYQYQRMGFIIHNSCARYSNFRTELGC